MESIETLNQRLIEHYGRDSNTRKPMFRIVWANDQLEKRLVDYIESGNGLAGIHLLHPEVREVKKYPYLKDLYVLERLVIVPFQDQDTLPVSKLSYEPIWAYRDGDDNPLTPVWPATKFIVDSLYAALGKKSLRKYVDSEKNTTPEGRDQRIKELEGELFGNETEAGDALRYKEGIVVPSNYTKEN
jgi:hypothetical protein